MLHGYQNHWCSNILVEKQKYLKGVKIILTKLTQAKTFLWNLYQNLCLKSSLKSIKLKNIISFDSVSFLNKIIPNLLNSWLLLFLVFFCLPNKISVNSRENFRVLLLEHKQSENLSFKISELIILAKPHNYFLFLKCNDKIM